MKISRIEIRAYHQFRDFMLCLTYPKGHENSEESDENRSTIYCRY